MIPSPWLRYFLVVLLIGCSGSMAPPDAGPPDAGPADAGPADAGPGDAGPGDGGAPDGGPPDGGPPDAGPLACDAIAHDPVLGTAQLGAAYRVLDSAQLPGSEWIHTAMKDELLPNGALALAVYGYRGDGFVHRLGVWPSLAAPSAGNVAFDAVPPEDRARQFLVTRALVNAQDKLLAGYRTLGGGSFIDGGISVFDPNERDAGTRWLAAPGIESALGLGSYFLVGGDGLGAAGGERGVYVVDHNEAELRAGVVATYPMIAGENVRPGLMALTSHGLVVLGYYLDIQNRHVLRLPQPAAIMDALSGGPAIALAQAPELALGADVAHLTGFQQGVAVLHSSRVSGILPAIGELRWYGLARETDGGTRVAAPAPVLTASDEGCTAVSQLYSRGTTLVVGLWDKQGQRLVRLVAR